MWQAMRRLRRCAVLCVVVLCSTGVRVQAASSGAVPAVAMIGCMPAGASGVQYISAAGHSISCGTDANGVPLVGYVNTTLVAASAADQGPMPGGAQVGLDIGGAVLLVLATAYGIRLLRNLSNSSSEG